MARLITKARKDAAFQAVLATLQDVPQAPKWPFSTITPEQWEALPQRVQGKIDEIMVDFVALAKGR